LTNKGYVRSQFEKAWKTSTPFDPSHRHNRRISSGNRHFDPSQSNRVVTDQIREIARVSAVCDGVTDQQGG
jgi:hypothetical protein